MPSAASTFPWGLDTVDRAEIQSEIKKMLLAKLEISLQCRSKVSPGERTGGRTDQTVTHGPGYVQEMTYLQRSIQGAGARYSYSITEVGIAGLRAPGWGKRVPSMAGQGQ